MSLEAVLVIVDRALADDGYRGSLFDDPAQALKGEDLSKSERAMLRGLTDSPYTSSPRGLQDLKKMVLASIEYRENE